MHLIVLPPVGRALHSPHAEPALLLRATPPATAISAAAKAHIGSAPNLGRAAPSAGLPCHTALILNRIALPRPACSCVCRICCARSACARACNRHQHGSQAMGSHGPTCTAVDDAVCKVMKQAGLQQATSWAFLHQTHVHATIFPRSHTSVCDHQSSAYITFLASAASAETGCANDRLDNLRQNVGVG